MQKDNAKPPRQLRFTEDSLRAAGFIETAPGKWEKNADHPLDRVDAPKHPKPARALDRKKQAVRRRKVGHPSSPLWIVTMTAHVRNFFDDDNLATAMKPIRDAVADHLGVDDGSGLIRWEVGQVETRGETGTMLKIEVIDAEGVDQLKSGGPINE